MRNQAYSKVVGEARPWRNGALGNLRWPVHVCRPIHEEAVKVKGCRLVAERVVDVDDDTVSYRGLDLGNGPLSVDANGRSVGHAIGIRGNPPNVKIILNGGGIGRDYRREESDEGNRPGDRWHYHHGSRDLELCWNRFGLLTP